MSETDQKSYFGADLGHFASQIRDPSSAYYGIAFSFLGDGALFKYVHVPSAQLQFLDDGKILRKQFVRAVFRNPEDCQRDAKLSFSELGVEFADQEKRCFDQTTAYIEFINSEKILVGE